MQRVSQYFQFVIRIKSIANSQRDQEQQNDSLQITTVEFHIISKDDKKKRFIHQNKSLFYIRSKFALIQQLLRKEFLQKLPCEVLR